MLLDKDERYYHPLQQDGDGEQSLATPPFQGRNYKGYAIVSTILLILSMSMNIKFIVAEFLSTSSNNNHTAYGNLADDIMLPWTNTTDYTSSNQTLSDEMFKALNTDDGVIAVDPEWAAARGLPPSTGRFPWDTEKRLYVINGYHGIHCIAQLHRSLREYRDGLPQSHAFEHNNHCLDWLRNDIMCQADDTPLYTDNTRHSTNGIGQTRQCRDWGKMEAWAKTHTACFRYGNFVVDEKKEDQIGRFKFCPDDSPYLSRVRRYYGMGEDWFPSHLPYEDVE